MMIEQALEQKPADFDGLLVNMQEKLQAGKGNGYARRAKIFNLKLLRLFC